MTQDKDNQFAVEKMIVGETSTHGLNKLLTNIRIFKGSFPADKVPLAKPVGVEAYIINTEPARQEGEHWVALVITKKKCFYFDSFGKQLLNLHILSQLKNIGVSDYKFSIKQIQPVLSSSCGYYCAAFILSHKIGMSYTSFIQMFSSNLEKNDQICYKFLEENLFK